MADIRKRVGKKGTTYQVRYPSKATKSGYAYATFNTLKEARAFREDSRARKHSKPLSTEIVTIEDGMRKWLDVCEHEGRKGRDPVTAYTLKNYRYLTEITLRYNWAKDLHELTAPDIVEFRSWLLRNCPRDQARKTLSAFHSMILEMVSRGILPHDIAAGISVSGKSRYDSPVEIPSVRDVQALLAAADRLANSRNAQIQRTWERYRPMLYLAADSGMRPQEYIVLPRFNIDDHGVTVDRALERSGRKISVTKTPAGRRYIDLSPHTLEMITHYADKKVVPNAHDLVFPTKTGRWQSPSNWRNRGFCIACIEAGLIKRVMENGKIVEKPKYKPYDLRHFYASMLIDQRMNLKKIQHLMGHRDIQTTLNIYGHLIDKADADDDRHNGLLASL